MENSNITIYFLFLCGILQAQEIPFKGKIIADSIAFREVNVVNLSSKQGTINQKSGQFQISAKAGDTIFFSSLQYQPYQITVAAEDFKTEKSIFLFPLVNELEEVNISNINLTGLLNKDIEAIETEAYLDASNFGLPVVKNRSTLAERRIYTAGRKLIWSEQSITPNLVISVDRVLNEVSGKMAMLRRQRKYEVEEILMQKAQGVFSVLFYTQELQIPENLIEDFLYYCLTFKPFQYLIKEEKKTLALTQFVKNKSVLYKQMKKIEYEPH